jgi:hypothetical protein
MHLTGEHVKCLVSSAKMWCNARRHVWHTLVATERKELQYSLRLWQESKAESSRQSWLKGLATRGVTLSRVVVVLVVVIAVVFVLVVPDSPDRHIRLTLLPRFLIILCGCSIASSGGT